MMKTIYGHTQLYGIIGSPVAHSLSPLFQNYFLSQAGLEACYLPFLVESNNIKQALLGLHAANIQGLNITIPHKESILTLVSTDQDAQIIGAVNTVKRTPDGWDAINTDWLGFASVLKGLQVNIGEKPTLLFGAGGTSRAILHALHHSGARQVFLCNRNYERAVALVDSVQKNYPSMTITPIKWVKDDVDTALKQSHLIINSTSIGLNEDDVFPFELSGSGFAIDAVYKPHGHTVFCKTAANYTTTDGLPMLVAQGVASFRYWFSDKVSTSSNLPNEKHALQWTEKELGRKSLNLPGWGS